MQQISLTRYFRIGALLPLACTVIAGIILAVTHVQDKNYKSEYFPDDGFKQAVFLFIGVSLLLSVFSMTMMLNRKPQIAMNALYSLCAFILVPVILVSVILYNHLRSINTTDPIDRNVKLDTFLIVICVIHLIALLISYFLYRRKLSQV